MSSSPPSAYIFPKPIGLLDNDHDCGVSKLIVFCDPSKSSIYDVTSPLKLFPLGAPGIKYAISPRTERLEGTSVCTFGSLLTSLVNKGISFENTPSKPNIVLLIGSVPKFAFWVKGLS